MTNETPFSKNAEMYRDEKVFAEGEDLGLMIKTAECRAEHRVLDIGAGAGHTALAFSPYVQECIGVDATKEMRWLRLRPPSRKKKELKTYAFSKERQSHSPSPTIHLTSSPADTQPTIFQMSAKLSARLHAY